MRGAGTSALSIGEVARRTGHTVVALRHWEAVGLLPPPAREGGARRYAKDILGRIEMIDLVRRAGFTLEEARRLLDAREPDRGPGREWRALVERKEAELDELLAAASAARALLGHLGRCRCRSLDECLAHARAAAPVTRR